MTDPLGKRTLRRRDNAEFAHNPHVAPPTTADWAHPLQLPSPTFPDPLPSYLPRSLDVPPARPPPELPRSSVAGLFSLSLRGARRDLRARPSSPYLVSAIESHLAAWLRGGTYVDPDRANGLLRFPGDPVGGRQDIREVAREPATLVWAVGADLPRDGAFERYVVHCVARWYGVVSFSKEVDGRRLTYLLRPNVTRPDPRLRATSALDTPPATDASLSDFNASDVDSVAGDPPPAALSDIEESRPSSPSEWSAVGGSSFPLDEDEGPEEQGFAASTESLSPNQATADATAPRGGHSTHFRARDRLRTLYPRSSSSPSPARRSPHRLSTARRPPARRKGKAKMNAIKGLAGAIGTDKRTFYDYLFA